MQNVEISHFAHLAFFFMALSFFMKDILWLRLLSIISSSLFVLIGINVKSIVYEAQVFWHITFIFIHFVRAGFLIYQRYFLRLTKFEESIYRMLNKKISAQNIKKIISVGHIHDVENDYTPIKKGSNVETIGLIIEGEGTVLCENLLIKDLTSGSFYGEFSFVTGKKASADVIIKSGAKVISWDQKVLEKYLTDDEILLNKFKEILGFKLMESIKN
jgi:hypothetical protein